MTHSIDLFKSMYEGVMVITPNNRLSQHLIHHYELIYRPTHPGTLVKPLCFSYEAALTYFYEKTIQQYAQSSHPMLLSKTQQRQIWSMVLEKQADFILSTDMLEVIYEAWQRCIFWQIPPDHPSLQQTQYTRRFQLWYQIFQQQLDELQAITVEQLPTYFMSTHHPIQLPPIIWTCFDEFTPLQKSLQQTLSAQNCPQLFDDHQKKLMAAQCFAAPNPQEEFLQALLWAQSRVQHGDREIAIIVPNLQQQIQAIQHLCAQHLANELYNISYGSPLLDYPIIQTAIQWLHLDLDYLNAAQIRMLLHSPFLHGGQIEFAIRSQLLQDSPIMKTHGIPWIDFLEQIKPMAPRLYDCLQRLRSYPQSASPYAWSGYFKERLDILGFPGETPIDSNLYQCLKSFYILFDELMSLTAVTPTLTHNQALDRLKDLAVKTIFQTQKSRSPITILGILEASGCRYDSIWVTGLTDQCLPQKTKFSPFLPIHLQKELAMPHTHAQREFERAHLVLARLGYASNIIIYSYPSTLSDQPQLPCTLIAGYPAYLALPFPKPECQNRLESYSESYYLAPQFDEQLSGGTALLASQAKCPFQAFASHRLKIRTNSTSPDGIDLAERGQILHRVLEKVWTHLQQQSQLSRLSPAELKNMIATSIATTLRDFTHRRPHGLSPLAQEVEQDRLQQLVEQCLSWEQQRSPFQIAGLEQSFQFNLGGLPLQIRMDRLDQEIESQHKIVIDYKTSLPTSKPWLEERPEAPQLLLYALLDAQIDTLIFIQLKAGRIAFQGLSARANPTSGIQVLKEHESWSTYKQHWEQQLSLLATEIQQGYCAPKPKRASLCQQCSVHTICRIEK